MGRLGLGLESEPHDVGRLGLGLGLGSGPHVMSRLGSGPRIGAGELSPGGIFR